jgi:hypothetical protein
MSIATVFDRLSGKEQQTIIKTLREIRESRKKDPEGKLFKQPEGLRKVALNYLMKQLEEEHGKGTIILNT